MKRLLIDIAAVAIFGIALGVGIVMFLTEDRRWDEMCEKNPAAAYCPPVETAE